jgi:hypothetical protein
MGIRHRGAAEVGCTGFETLRSLPASSAEGRFVPAPSASVFPQVGQFSSAGRMSQMFRLVLLSSVLGLGDLGRTDGMVQRAKRKRRPAHLLV